MMRRYGRTGWFGDSRGHSLAAQGIRLYARKQHLVDPMFYARRREEVVPFTDLQMMARRNMTYGEMKGEHPTADPDDIRVRGMKAVESVDGDGTLSSMDRDGVDALVQTAESNGAAKARMLQVLGDRRRVSFLPELKVQLLKKRLEV